ncbi:MAG: hypothetical protein WA737_10230 [Candidatus Acidiferrales bacterium]
MMMVVNRICPQIHDPSKISDPVPHVNGATHQLNGCGASRKPHAAPGKKQFAALRRRGIVFAQALDEKSSPERLTQQ